MTKNKLYRRIIGLADFIQELGKYDYYNKASNIAIQDYNKLIQYFKDNFEKIDAIHYDKLYRLINGHIIPNIRYIQRTETKNIPWSLISNLDEILKNELGDNCWLLFRPQWHFNYSVITEDLVTYLKKILFVFFPDDKEINNIFSNERINIFSFPFLEKTNVLSNSIIGHEIGHFYHKKWEQNDYNQIKENYNKILKKYYDNLSPDDMITPYINTEEGMSILDGMYREIISDISDIYGYYLFGSSIIFALLDLSEFEVRQMLPSKENDYYPSNKYRIRILVKYLLKKDTGVNSLLADNNDCSKYLKNYISDINEYLQKDDDIILFSQKRNKEKELFESSLPDIIEKIKNSIKHDYIKYENTNKLFKNLNENLPINEINYVPINIMQIIFAGWIYYKKINEDYSGDEYVLNYQILMRILLKSLHSSFIHKKYIDKV
jgi:hypothetical protein